MRMGKPTKNKWFDISQYKEILKVNKMEDIIEFNGEVVELGESYCSCCGNRRVVKETNMCPECIIFCEKVFYDTRIDILEKLLSDKNKERFSSMTFGQKKHVINELIKEGKMI